MFRCQTRLVNKLSFERVPGPNRSDPEETKGKESYDECCKEVPER